MRILFTGSRNYTNRDKVRYVLEGFFRARPELITCQGGARGLDTLVKEEANKLGIPCETYKAEWDKYGKAAGPIRNQLMLDQFNPDLVVYFTEDLEKSKGTKDMVTRAKKNKIFTMRGG